jgi:Protein of unknown function (DUF2569)
LQKKRIFPILFVAYLSIQFLTTALDVIMVYCMHPDTVSTQEQTAALMMVPMFFFSILWSAYMLRSKRVKLTFVN